MQIIKYVFQQHGDSRGQLVALEENKDIPFEINNRLFKGTERRRQNRDS